MTTVATHRDRLLRFESDLMDQVPKGAPLYDWLPRIARPNIVRSYGLTPMENDRRVFECEPGVILCGGAAVGLDRHGRLQHIRRWHALQGFVGFVEKTIASGRVLVRTRGQVMVVIPGGDKRVPGTPVFCLGADEFSLKPIDGGYEAGAVLYVQPERYDLVCLSFKSFNDPDPLDLSLPVSKS